MGDDNAFLRKLLEDADHYISLMQPTPGARELKSRLDQYRRVFTSWTTRSPGEQPRHPSEEQRSALRDQLQELLRLAKGAAPTIKMRKPGA